MTDKKDLISKGKELLDFDAVKDLTLEEAVRKDLDLQAGVTAEDGVLDKYIKHNREQVTSQKFDQQTIDLSELKSANLDDFISDQRQNLDELKQTVGEKVAAVTQVDKAVIDDVKATSAQFSEKIGLGAADESSSSKKKLAWLGIPLILLATLLGLVYAWLRGNQSATNAVPTATKTEQAAEAKTTSAKATDKEASDKFDKLYASFFADNGQTKLKNSEFAKLPELETALKVLEETDGYDAAKAKYDRLAKSIESIEAINAKFETPAIVDGEKVAATLLAGASLDDVSSELLNTGNATLDSLLQSVVAEGRTQLNGESVTAAAGAGGDLVTDQSAVAATGEVGQVSGAVVEAAAPAPVQTAPIEVVAPAITYGTFNVGITSYDPSTLNRAVSRVPYNWDLIADSTNDAWNFNPGILENIVAISQQRGYITGHDYILEKVNIVNGNGYYNMYKPDGTYLFTINAKTGYFVGNAAGNADALDY